MKTLDRTVAGFSYNRRGTASIYDRNYLYPGDGSIKDKLFAFLEKTEDVFNISRVMLVTSPGLIFSVFNPVSFYYCFTSLDEVACVVAEVNNTFGDRHLYILNPSVQTDKSVGEFTVAKNFNVSPFNHIEGEYKFYIGPLDQGVDTRITMRVNGEKKVFASLQGEHLSIAGKNHLAIRLRNPFQPHLTVILPDNSCLESGDPSSREYAVLEIRKKGPADIAACRALNSQLVAWYRDLWPRSRSGEDNSINHVNNTV